jgi:hypothetical protein
MFIAQSSGTTDSAAADSITTDELWDFLANGFAAPK